MCLVDGYNETVPKIQVEKGGRWYQVKQINQASTFNLYDEELGKQLESAQPSIYLFSFLSQPNLSQMQCHSLY